MALFTEHYLAIDYGSTQIKGALYQSGPGGTRILRVESLPIVSISSMAHPVQEVVVDTDSDEDSASKTLPGRIR